MTEDQKQQIRKQADELVRAIGVTPAARKLGILPESLVRLIAGTGVRKGTLLTVACALGMIGSQADTLAISSAPRPHA